ncbi:MAG: bifunctional (p)ppGpp synthetase/guanosine-3',5'-bis(diphosphate) 3'-pyrophosphohydrolase [Merismopedia sp. SIO2A8]|nr:bifunctional (p)ppGpp synthetase/guanosine-3',5'-bis(diphosphate) 3'-pyrophosphohydrolase [Merismopedia sp. SIO2A8]
MTLEPTTLILKALDFAARKHKDQRRKGRDAAPYINHPIELVTLLWQKGGVRDEVVIAAALLHDTVEDTDTTFDELEQEFGHEIRMVVAEVTDDKTLPKEQRKQYQIDHAPHLTPKARLVKLADKIANLRDMMVAPPANWSDQRKLEYVQWGKKVVDPIRGTHPDLEALFDDVYEQGVVRFSER